ncbi:MAG: DUF177 domain-containing protein [Bacillota bacterium]|nr:DUF177 domain-containing protein [Bacillota bacterium]
MKSIPQKDVAGGFVEYSWEVPPGLLRPDLPYRVLAGPPLLLEISPLKRSQVAQVAGREGEGVELHLKGELTLEYPCDRCLKPAPETLSLDYRVRLLPEDLFADLSFEAREGDVDGYEYLPYDGKSIPLMEILLVPVMLALPAKHLCRPDCRGLCPTCGHDLNEGPCGCEDRPVDPRWEALLRLKPALQGGEEGKGGSSRKDPPEPR